MRRALTAAALVLAALALPAGRAAADGGSCSPDYQSGTHCQEVVSVTTPGRPSSSGGHARADPDYVSFPMVVRAGHPGDCVASLAGGSPTCSPSGLDLPAGTPDCLKAMGIGRAPDLKSQAQQEWQQASATHPMCPATGAGAGGADPVLVALRAWQDIPLPQPGPYIAPGWAITGRAAYLETRGERSHTYHSDTPAGPLTLEATGRYYVDWGDGTHDGPYASEGRPWPDGQITHIYIDVGTYDVVVTEEWTSTWRIGDSGGQFGSQRTQGRIPGFRVEQIQAVRLR